MPDLLSPAELADLRQTVQDLTMPGTALILRGVNRTYTDSGGYKDIGGTVMAGTAPLLTPCRYRPSSAEEKQRAGKTVTDMVWTVTVPAEWDVRQTDRLQILGINRVFEVSRILGPQVMEIQRKIVCTESVGTRIS